MNIHNISTISRYETKLLRRSWLFRIFAILSLLVIVFFHMGTQSNLGWFEWVMVAILHPVCQYLPFQYRTICHCHILGRELFKTR